MLMLYNIFPSLIHLVYLWMGKEKRENYANILLLK